MGLAYTIDTPIKVARFGISSVISIVEDRLVEMMRKYYYPIIGMEYEPISTHEEDYRAKRITDYLNLVNTIVQAQIEKLKIAAFEAGSEIVKYFEMLPDDSMLKQSYYQMLQTGSRNEKERIETFLRANIRPGNIDVNIMTKVDRNNFNKKGELLVNGSDAISALRGFVNSDLRDSSVVFSAGMNPRLYNYLEDIRAFDLDEDEKFTKKVIVKVSDYRSALIQGKYLAKKGIWVSEFRIESGLNCGGHAFATDGYLMGPILEEFKTNKKDLILSLFELYSKAVFEKRNRIIKHVPDLIFSVQGGIGTHEEDWFLHTHYNIESTGWGTPFLLVPEATTVEEETLKLLREAKEKDVVLSHNSPLGIRFYYLKGTSAEKEKLQRIRIGRSGSPCTEKHLAFNTEFSQDPICTASQKYQKLKIAQLKSSDLPKHEYEKQMSAVLDKECLCIGLSNSAAIKYHQTFVKKLNAVTICPGPNIAHFSQIVSLQTMVNHIYGKRNIISSVDRPHMFIAELRLYVDFLKEQLEETFGTEHFLKKKKYFTDYYQNLVNGINYYKELTAFISTDQLKKSEFLTSLNFAEKMLKELAKDYSILEKV
jgi:hypothetical protein